MSTSIFSQLETTCEIDSLIAWKFFRIIFEKNERTRCHKESHIKRKNSITMKKIYDIVEDIKTKDIKRKHYMYQMPLNCYSTR